MIILLIEDDVGIAELLKDKLFEEGGHETACVHSADAALTYLAGQTPDLLIIDYGLPDMNGKALLEALYNTGRSLPPFVVSTGQGDERVAVDMMKLGARDYVVKDISFLDLLPQTIKRIEHELKNEKKLKEAEARLLATETLQRTVLDALDEAIHLIDNHFRFRLLNKKFKDWCEQLRLDGNVIGKTLHDAFPFFSDTLISEYQQVFATGLPLITQEQTTFGERTMITETRKIPVKSDEQVTGVLTIIADITERKRAEEALAESEKKFRAMTEQMTDVVFVTNAHGIITYISPAAQHIFGIMPHDMEGRPFMEFLVERDVNTAICYFAKTILTGMPSSNLELQMRRKDGSVFIGELNATLFQQDHLVGTLGLIRDITERRQMEQALRDSEEHYRTLFEHLPIPVFTKNRSGQYISSNAENLRYWSSSPVGRTDAELLPPEVAAVFRDNDLQVLETGAPLTVEEYFPCTPIGECRFLSRKVPLRDNSGQIIGILGASLDITEQKRMEAALRLLNDELELRVKQRTAQLEAANQELGEFAYVVSHDLKAPLRGIYRLAQWLKEDYADKLGEQGVEQLALLFGQVKRMDILIDGILRYSKAVHGSEREESVPLNVLVPQVIATLIPPVNVTIEIEDALPIIQGDPVRITQVFQNLLGNAIKFMDKPEGKITVGYRDAGETWRFWVADNGPGIEPCHHERIFNIFQTTTTFFLK